MEHGLLSPAAIALNRFGLGARPEDRSPLDAQRFLKEQFEHYDPAPKDFAQLPDAGILVQHSREQRRQMRALAGLQAQAQSTMAGQGEAFLGAQRMSEQAVARKKFSEDAYALYRQAVHARLASALLTDAPFVERMVHFWSNHFCVSSDNQELKAFAGEFEHDAIRPHVLGRFEDMLFAVERHPAMLIYLNQAQSTGPNSPAAKIAAKRGAKHRGINENLAREIMELHTLGVRSGYTQADVVEFARAMTGWSVVGLGAQSAKSKNDNVTFGFRSQLHEPGTRTIMGHIYQQPGIEQASAVLSDLARAPQTATHVATKLARHFAGDTPPQDFIRRLAETFSKSGGDMKALYTTLIESPEAWAPEPLKFKTPWEWTVSALRGLGQTDSGKMRVDVLLQQLGQPVWKPGSPAGWDDIAANWATSNALLRLAQVAQRFAAQRAPSVDARLLAPQLLVSSVSQATSEQLARAESPVSALALLLMSPDFLRR